MKNLLVGLSAALLLSLSTFAMADQMGSNEQPMPPVAEAADTAAPSQEPTAGQDESTSKADCVAACKDDQACIAKCDETKK